MQNDRPGKIIRELMEKDVDQVCVLEEEAFSMPWHKESFLEMIRNPDAMYLVALGQNDEVTGCCGVRNIVMEGDISNVVVKRAERGKGTGRALMTELMIRAVEKYGIQAFTLEVRVSNTAAIKLYQSLGFVNEGIRPDFYEKPIEDAMIMWKR